MYKIICSFLGFLLCAGSAQANALVDTSGVKGGLVVHLNCGKAEKTVGLLANEKYLVQGLDPSAANVVAARNFVQSKGLYGKITVAGWNGSQLPYTDNVVNLLIVSQGASVSESELLRVLAPKGVALIEGGSGKTVAIDGLTWAVLRKPWPDNIDEWTHELHDASGNAVAQDSAISTPNSLQWVNYPSWGKNHDVMPDMSAMVSSDGRIFYISEESEPGVDPQHGMPDQWFLVSRDAFNGIELWRTPISEWGWKAWSGWSHGRNNQPTHIGYRMVCKGDRVYVTLGFNAPVTELDATTGKILRTFAGTEYAEELLLYGDHLILSINQEKQAPDEASDQEKKLSQKTSAPINPRPPVKKWIAVVELKSGKTIWKKGDFVGMRSKTGSMDRITHLNLVAGDGQVFFFPDRMTLASLDLKTGKERWRTKRPDFLEHTMRYNLRVTDRVTLVYNNGVLVFGHPNPGKTTFGHKKAPALYAGYSAKNGHLLWKRDLASWGWAEPPDIFVIDSKIWVYSLKEFALLGLDLKTGKELKRIDTTKELKMGHHHRCYRNRSTENIVMAGHRGIEMFNLETGESSNSPWVRGACQFGVMPANGMIYAGPHPCECFMDSKLNGVLSVASRTAPAPAKAELIQGPAFGKVTDTGDYPWPMYRQNSARGAATDVHVSEILKPKWQVQVPGQSTAAVIGEGKVVVASKADNTVYAFDQATGKKVWSYTLDGATSVPPTLYKGMALVGSKDGYVYNLRLKDGQLIWRFRAAPVDRKIVAYGHLESMWPVYGVLVHNDTAYVTAGRSSFLDGGIHAYALDPVSGTVKDQKVLKEERVEFSGAKSANGRLADIMLAVDDSIYMRNKVVFGDAEKTPYIYAEAGILEQSWFNRANWKLGDKNMGQYFVHDGQNVYVLKASERKTKGSMVVPGSGNYLLYSQSVNASATPMLSGKMAKAKSSKKSKKKKGGKPAPAIATGPSWQHKIPLRVIAMAKTADMLFVAGSPDVVKKDDPWAALEGRAGGVLRAVSLKDGSTLKEYKLAAVPVLDGISVAEKMLFVVTKDGVLRAYEN